MKPIDNIKIDKTKFSVSSLYDDSDEKMYWSEKTPEERLAALEVTRQIMYGYDPLSTRLQRILTIAEIPQS